MRKIFITALSLMLALSLCACGNSTETPAPTGEAAEQSQPAEQSQSTEASQPTDSGDAQTGAVPFSEMAVARDWFKDGIRTDNLTMCLSTFDSDTTPGCMNGMYLENYSEGDEWSGSPNLEWQVKDEVLYIHTNLNGTEQDWEFITVDPFTIKDRLSGDIYNQGRDYQALIDGLLAAPWVSVEKHPDYGTYTFTFNEDGTFTMQDEVFSPATMHWFVDVTSQIGSYSESWEEDGGYTIEIVWDDETSFHLNSMIAGELRPAE